jgi:hypothetical protein
MPCEWLKAADGTVMHINRDHSRGPKRHCKFCGKDYYGGKLCDFPLGEGRTCDAQMCDGCCRTLGRGEVEIGGGMKRLNDTFDVCPLHRGMAAIVDGKIVAKEAQS